MTPALRERVNRLGKHLRRFFDPPYEKASDGAPAMAARKGPQPVTEQDVKLREATDKMASAAAHGKTVAKLIQEQTDPDRPDSFEARMRKLLSQIQ